MKKLIVIATVFASANLSAQTHSAEAEIRRLEQLEVQAVLQKDSGMLLQLWASDFTVNAPDNAINFAGRTTLDRAVLKRPRVGFTREVEHVTVKGNFAFSMGSETVQSTTSKIGGTPIIKRRFTNIWERQAGGWKLVGRHANEICGKN